MKRSLLLALLCLSPALHAQSLPLQEDPRLQPMFSSGRVWNGVTTAPDGRVFVAYTNADTPGIELAELVGGQPRPYPDAAWNVPPGAVASAGSFFQVNSIRIGPDGALWVVDAGAKAIGKPAVPGAARLISIDLATNRVKRIYPLGAVLKPKSFVDDVRFNGGHAYLSDAGEPALLVLDLGSGAVRRVLDGHPSTTDFRPMLADGKILLDEKGQQVRVHADQLEVTPDRQTLIYMPASGPASKIGTRWLDDPAVTPEQLAMQVQPWIDSPTTGGTAMDSQGDLYMGDADHRQILRYTPDGKRHVILIDKRLIWSDAMWIDAKGYLWIPAPQMNRTPGMNGGVNAVDYPVWIYRTEIDRFPPPADHP